MAAIFLASSKRQRRRHHGLPVDMPESERYVRKTLVAECESIWSPERLAGKGIIGQFQLPSDEDVRTVAFFRDLAAGLAMWQLWTTLAWNDIRQRYQRSVIGPFWITLGMGVMIGSIGFVYGEIFGVRLHAYLPFLAVGFIGWALLSGMVMEACTVFTASEGIIHQVRVPYGVHVFRMIWRNLIVFVHNILIYIVLILLFDVHAGLISLLVVPALILIAINSVWIGYLLGAFNARFRDFNPLMSNLLQVIFYLTPIVWMPKQLPAYREFVFLNPFYYFVDLIRSPLLGSVPALSSWMVVLGITVAGYLVTGIFFRRYRTRIAYWL